MKETNYPKKHLKTLILNKAKSRVLKEEEDKITFLKRNRCFPVLLENLFCQKDFFEITYDFTYWVHRQYKPAE